MKILNKIKCFLGLHDWAYNGEPCDFTRTCNRCNVKMKAAYDPMYGSTDWEKVYSD